jgi:hypothetical protein
MRRILFNWAAIAVVVMAPAVVNGADSQDTQVAEQIATILRDSGKMRNYSVGVKYKNGTVWLNGRVTSQQQMQAALQVVSDIEGVEQIVNGMTVGKSGLKQPLGMAPATSRSAARTVSATPADLGEVQAGQAPDGEAAPAGYHHLQRAARHAPPAPMYAGGAGPVPSPALDQPNMPAYAWPSYAAYPNYAALTYPKQYSPTAWPFIGPFYPYPQVPLGWRKVALEWDDGWWFLDFYDRSHH